MKTEEGRRTSILINKELYRKIKIISAYKDCTVNDCIVEALEKYTEENRKFLK